MHSSSCHPDSTVAPAHRGTCASADSVHFLLVKPPQAAIWDLKDRLRHDPGFSEGLPSVLRIQILYPINNRATGYWQACSGTLAPA